MNREKFHPLDSDEGPLEPPLQSYEFIIYDINENKTEEEKEQAYLVYYEYLKNKIYNNRPSLEQ